LEMNSTQCRTGSDDFLVDPQLVRNTKSKNSEPCSGFLTGAYCTESELLTLRRLEFPLGVDVGDTIVLPNTAGYFMHFRESRSHQFQLAKNVVCDEGSNYLIDPIDLPR
ncbi:MAG: Y4yA family PLP-dependent enzyme, partial [Lacipirellulaceae bacterium]